MRLELQSNYLPGQDGLRFSPKALRPSLASSVIAGNAICLSVLAKLSLNDIEESQHRNQAPQMASIRSDFCVHKSTKPGFGALKST